MSVQMMGAVIASGPQDRTQFCVMITLANYADEFGFAYPSLATIAADARCDEKTARRQIAELEDAGWLYVARKVLNSKSNIYILNIEKMGVTAPADSRRSPLFMRLLKKSPGAMTPIFGPKKSPGMDTFSGDNPQGGQRAFEESHRAKEGGSPGKLCPTNRYNRQSLEPSGTTNEVEPLPLPLPGATEKSAESEPFEAKCELCGHAADDFWGVAGSLVCQNCPEPMESGTRPHLVASFDRMRTALKMDLNSMPRHPNFTEIRAGANDWDTCFRDWWFLSMHSIYNAHRRIWTFVTTAADVAITERGVAKYLGRIAKLIRVYMPIPQNFEIRFTVLPRADIRPAA